MKSIVINCRKFKQFSFIASSICYFSMLDINISCSTNGKHSRSQEKKNQQKN